MTPEAGSELPVELGFPERERRGGRAVGLVQRRDQLRLVQLRGRDGQCEPVPVAERVRGCVAQARQLADVVCHRGPDRLGRLPRRPALIEIVALPQDQPDLVVVDGAASDLTAVLREQRVDRGLESDRARTELGRNLSGEEQVPEELEPPQVSAVRHGACRLDRGEPLAVGENIGERGFELDAPALVLDARNDVEIPEAVLAGRVEGGEVVVRCGLRQPSGSSSRASLREPLGAEQRPTRGSRAEESPQWGLTDQGALPRWQSEPTSTSIAPASRS